MSSQRQIPRNRGGVSGGAGCLGTGRAVRRPGWPPRTSLRSRPMVGGTDRRSWATTTKRAGMRWAQGGCSPAFRAIGTWTGLRAIAICRSCGGAAVGQTPGASPTSRRRRLPPSGGPGNRRRQRGRRAVAACSRAGATSWLRTRATVGGCRRTRAGGADGGPGRADGAQAGRSPPRVARAVAACVP